MNLIKKTELIATKAHEGQFRRDGVTPYIVHPKRVMEDLKLQGCDKIVLATALLHDLLEDTTVTEADLSAQGVSWRVIDAVKVLTRSKNQSYEEYLKGVASNPMARLVKLADIRHNMSDSPTERQVAKYAKALIYLEQPRPAGAAVLWLSLPDSPELQDAPLLTALRNGDAWTTDMRQAARIAGMGHTVKRRDRHVAGHLVETALCKESLEISIDRGIEMRGAPELNRPSK